MEITSKLCTVNPYEPPKCPPKEYYSDQELKNVMLDYAALFALLFAFNIPLIAHSAGLHKEEPAKRVIDTRR